MYKTKRDQRFERINLSLTRYKRQGTQNGGPPVAEMAVKQLLRAVKRVALSLVSLWYASLLTNTRFLLSLSQNKQLLRASDVTLKLHWTIFLTFLFGWISIMKSKLTAYLQIQKEYSKIPSESE